MIEDLQKDPEAVWPSSGEMVVLIQNVLRSDKFAIPGTMSIKARRHHENQNINGWRYDQIINLTKEGRRAKARGYPHKFLMSLANGERDLPFELSGKPPEVKTRDHAN